MPRIVAATKSEHNGSVKSGTTQAEVAASYRKAVRRETNAAFTVVQRNARLDFWVRAAVLAAGTVALAAAIVYTLMRSDDMVGVLLSDEKRLVTLTWPVILLVLLAVISFVAAFLIQTRGSHSFERNMDGVSRLRREAEGGVSRTRTSTHALEEYYANARRAFRLQLWLGRTLFVVCLVLFTAAVVDALLSKADLGTVVLAGGSILSILVASVTGAATKVGNHLADMTQMQIVVGGAARQVNALEDHMYQVLERKTAPPLEASTAVIDHGTKRIQKVVADSLALIQFYAEPVNEPENQAQDEL